MLQTAPITARRPYRNAEDNGERPLTGPKFLAILLGFFAIIASVNATMVYCALSTFRGEVDPHPYEHGLAFNKDIAAAEAQDARHWHVEAHVSADVGESAGMKTIETVFHDGNNKVLDGLNVAAKLEFATDMKRDHSLKLVEMAPGVYRGNILVASGQWDLVIEAKRNANRLFFSRSRIAIP